METNRIGSPPLSRTVTPGTLDLLHCQQANMKSFLMLIFLTFPEIYLGNLSRVFVGHTNKYQMMASLIP